MHTWCVLSFAGGMEEKTYELLYDDHKGVGLMR